MKSNELRIGNYLQIDSLTDGSNTIVDIDLFHLNEIGSIKYQYNPIPLTEEWLIKFGFYISNRKGSTITDYVIVKDNFGYFEVFCIDITKGLGFAGCKYKIKHVHQLQNLYFALTNEELTIK